MNKEAILKEINNKLSCLNDLKKKKLIATILQNPYWYIDLKTDIVINIFLDLGYNKEETLELYKKLMIQ